ncbi:hypothetical protein J0X15_10795 [Roseibium sp. CAU 1637]|uniref:Yip1 domain-containing protein n=1 Tax=Roseibium limicola TaxID=2816037 RepID=A0A939EPJ5_9HYPH|nr:hypothetical protein [Roseibium limicola]
MFGNRPEGERYFDTSIEGFWRSFQVVILLLPFLILNGLAGQKLIAEEGSVSPEELAASFFWQSQFTGYALDWVTMPILLALLSGVLGISRTFIPYIVVRNWASLLGTFPHTVIAALYLMGAVSSGLMVLMSLSTFVVILWYHFRIARLVLQANISLAFGVVILDVLLSLLVGELVGRFWGI